ncbi:hypothetical protein Tco_1394357 [Tanacetum coccineum]
MVWSGYAVLMSEKTNSITIQSIEDEEVSLVDGVLEGALGALGDEIRSLGDEVFVSSWVKSTNNCLGGMMLIFGLLEALEIEALVEAMEAIPNVVQAFWANIADTSTYTSVSFPVEDDSDIGSPGVDGPPIMPEDPYAYIMAAYGVPPSPDYIPGPEGPPSPDYSEEQPLHAAASPTAESPGYIPESDPEEDPEEEDPEDDDEDEDEEEEEEHPAPADSVPPVHRMTARISIRDEPSISLPPREEVERLLALTTPPPSPLTPLSSPLPQIPSPPLPIPSPPPNSPTHIEILRVVLPLRRGCVLLLPPLVMRSGEFSSRCSRLGINYDITNTWDDLVGAIDEIATDRSNRGQSRDSMSSPLAVMISREASMCCAQSALISELQSADHRRQRVITELLALDHKRQVQLTKTLRLLKGLQTHMVEFQRQHRPAKGPAQPDAPGEARSFVQKKHPREDHEVNTSATPTPVTDTHTTTFHQCPIHAMIDEGVTAALAARDATKNGDDSHTSGTGARRPVQVARECTYPDFLKCQL